MNPKETVEAYFKAMQAGAEGADALFALFSDDAVYIEPFSGGRHEGRPAIEAYFRKGWTESPPDLRIEVHRIDVDGQQVRSEWTCHSPVFETPVSGRDVAEVHGGKITHLAVSLTP